MNWQTVPTGTIVYHQEFLTTPQGYTEVANQAEDATVYYAALQVRASREMDAQMVSTRLFRLSR